TRQSSKSACASSRTARKTASIAISSSIAERRRAWCWYPGKVALSFDNDPHDERGDRRARPQSPHRNSLHSCYLPGNPLASAEHRAGEIVPVVQQIEQDRDDVRGGERDEHVERQLVCLSERAANIEADEMRQRPRLEPIDVGGEQAERHLHRHRQ